MKAILLFCVIITVSTSMDVFKSPKSVKNCVKVSFIHIADIYSSFMVFNLDYSIHTESSTENWPKKSRYERMVRYA